MNAQLLKIPDIRLKWSDWIPWASLKIHARDTGGINVPNKSGVYEVKHRNQKKRLTIGKGSNLRNRVKQGLVKGNLPHSTGKKIRRKERTSGITVRWAITDRPAAAEEELHKRYRRKFGQLPKYTKHT